VDLSNFPYLRDFMARVEARPAVQQTMRAERIKVSA
jgi:glutathione S-transferase